jgi:hypothetical protein
LRKKALDFFAHVRNSRKFLLAAGQILVTLERAKSGRKAANKRSIPVSMEGRIARPSGPAKAGLTSARRRFENRIRTILSLRTCSGRSGGIRGTKVEPFLFPDAPGLGWRTGILCAAVPLCAPSVTQFLRCCVNTTLTARLRLGRNGQHLRKAANHGQRRGR